VHTDASIRSSKGGIGFCSRRDDSLNTFRARVHEHKDINRLELGAIFASIAMTDTSSDMIIYSDSQTSISNIVSTMKRSKYDKLAKYVLQLAYEKEGNIYVSKVKAHSGNEGNERADALAKEGTSCDFMFVLPDEFESIDSWARYHNQSSVSCMLKSI
jgi:ribonuclease HI